MKNSNDTKLWTTICFAIALAITDDLTANEQNAIGNWFVLLGQVLCTTAAIQQDIEEKIKGVTININSKQAKSGGHPFTENYIDVETLKRTIKKVEEELNNIKK